MKKIIVVTLTMIFALTLGVAYAREGGIVLNNGATDFSGRTYDTLSDIAPGAMEVESVESSDAGGMRSSDSSIEVSNGVTDFSGGSYDIGTTAREAMDAASAESSHAGGLRAGEPGIELFNGATNFSGRTYDTLSDLNR